MTRADGVLVTNEIEIHRTLPPAVFIPEVDFFILYGSWIAMYDITGNFVARDHVSQGCLGRDRHQNSKSRLLP